MATDPHGRVATEASEFENPRVWPDPFHAFVEQQALHRPDVHQEALGECEVVQGLEHRVGVAGLRMRLNPREGGPLAIGLSPLMLACRVRKSSRVRVGMPRRIAAVREGWELVIAISYR